MDVYGKILLVAIPAFLLLILFEKWYGYRRGFDTFRSMDLLSSLASGLTNATKDVLGLTLTILGYSLLVDHLAIYTVEATWLTYLIAFIVLDFAYYWAHLTMHKVNFFWNTHVIHHSSEEYNLGCALRQSISSFVKIFSVFLLPAALMGVPATVIATVAPLHLFAQFWYHTRHIGKLGLLEHIIVTPSLHRVHHAMNKEYIDKNMSAIFIIWDKLFGTYQEEMDDVPPIYGVTRPARTWNPIKINFQHLFLMISDAWRTKNVKDKFTIWFKPTGYRPADVEVWYPVSKIDDPNNFEKYNPRASPSLKYWSWTQLIITLFFAAYLFGNISYIHEIHPSYTFLNGGFIFLSVYALCELMDRDPKAKYWELLRATYGLGVTSWQGDWFGSGLFFAFAPYVIGGYLILSVVVTWWFATIHRAEDDEFSKQAISGENAEHQDTQLA